jgi:hypothetical protein
MGIRESLEYLFYAAVVALMNIGPPPEDETSAQEGDEPTVVASAAAWTTPAHRAPEGFFLGNQ